MQLYCSTDDGATWNEYWGDQVVISAGSTPNEWNYEWNLPACDAEGNPIKFKAELTDVPSIYTYAADAPDYTAASGDTPASTVLNFHNAYNDNWNYTVDLHWNVSDPLQKYAIDTTTTGTSQLGAVYNLTLSSQKTYAAKEFQVRLPYELFDARTGKTTGTVISAVSVGDESNPSSSYAFTYYIDKKGTADTSDDEIVFYNYKDITGNLNTTMQVSYNFYPQNVVDCSVGSISATVSAKYDGQTETEVQHSQTITYRLDTGVNSFTAYKKAWSSIESGRVYYWPTAFGTQPEDFDMTKYNYVVYQVSTSSLYSNQPCKVVFYDTPDSEGEVYKVQQGGYYEPSSGSSNAFTVKTDIETGAAVWTKEFTSYVSSNSLYFYVMVRYPRVPYPDPLNEGQTTYETDYKNDVEARFIATDEHEGDKDPEGNDKNDIVIRTANATMHWIDYVYHYDGDIYSSYKSYSYSFPDGALTYLGNGISSSCAWYINMTVNGYNYVDGYSFEMMDDAMYAYATIDGNKTDYVRLTEALLYVVRIITTITVYTAAWMLL